MEKKNKTRLIVLVSAFCILLAAFLSLLILVICKYNFKIDLLNEFIANRRTEFWNWFFKIFTYLGSWIVLSVITVFTLIFVKDKKVGVTFVLSVLLSATLSVAIKYIVGRIRPDNAIISEVGFSFPSAHAMISVAFYSVAIYFVLTKISKLSLKWIFAGLILSVMFLVGFSRVYLGVHYVSDVVAGWIMGLICAMISVIIYYIITKRKFKNKEN